MNQKIQQLREEFNGGKYNKMQIKSWKPGFQLLDELQHFLDTETNYCSPLPLVFEKAEKFRKEYFTK